MDVACASYSFSTDNMDSDNNSGGGGNVGTAAASRGAMYKNRGMTSDALRKRREETSIEIRKQKRYNDLNKRRQMDLAPSDSVKEMERDNALILNGVDEKVIAKLCGDRTDDIEEALDVYRRRLRKSDASDVADEIVALNLVPRIVELLRSGPTFNIRRHSTHIIGAIISYTSAHTETIVKTGIVPDLISLLNGPDRELHELALFALGNIAAECCQFRDLCIQCGMAKKMTQIPNDMTLMEARCAVWAASNLCRGKDPPVNLEEIGGLLPLLNEALYSFDTLIIADACRAFARLLDATPDELYKRVLLPSTVERLVGYLNNPCPNIWSAALLAIGNIVSGDDDQTQSVLNCTNALPNLHRLLLDGDQKTKREVCWALSNIAAGNVEQVQAIFDADIIPTLVHVLANETFQTRIEACWVIANVIAGGTNKHISQLVHIGTLLPLSDMLTVMDSNVVVVVLRALEEVLEAGESCKVDGQNPYLVILEELQAISKIEFLSLSPNSEIFTRACTIFEKYCLHVNEEPEKMDGGMDVTQANGEKMEPLNFL